MKPWAETNLASKPFLLFQDHLGCQKKHDYVNAVERIGGQCVYGPRNKTQVWQPIDAGHLGAILKATGKENFERWLCATSRNKKYPDKKNWELWESNKLSMREKRILVTWVFGCAWSRVCGQKFKHARVSAFLKTGLLLTLTGVNDWCVAIPGLKDPGPGMKKTLRTYRVRITYYVVRSMCVRMYVCMYVRMYTAGEDRAGKARHPLRRREVWRGCMDATPRLGVSGRAPTYVRAYVRSAVQRSAVRSSAMQFSAVQRNALQSNAAHCCAVQYVRTYVGTYVRTEAMDRRAQEVDAAGEAADVPRATYVCTTKLSCKDASLRSLVGLGPSAVFFFVFRFVFPGR